MSGFEIAGTMLAVLGVLPIFTKVGKKYATERKALWDAFDYRKCDEELSIFYQSLWYQTAELRCQIEDLFESLPDISQSRKAELLNFRELGEWEMAADIVDSLHILFPDTQEYKHCESVINSIADTLGRLLNDSSIGSQRDAELSKIRDLYDDHYRHGNYLERFRFLKRREDRETCLRRLAKGRRYLRRLLERASPEYVTSNTSARPESVSRPALHSRDLCWILFTALWRIWPCDCDTPHEGRFSLAQLTSTDTTAFASHRQVSFDFLVARSRRKLDDPLDQTMWKEATVSMDEQSVSGLDDPTNHSKVTQICKEIHRQRDPDLDNCLMLLVEKGQVEAGEMGATVRRLHWGESKLSSWDIPSVISLDALLRQGTRTIPPLSERRKLALLLAGSVLQLHESPFLGRQWDKRNIFFFCETSGKPDLRRPYMSAPFTDFPRDTETSNLDVFHRNPGLLNLGILLIELEKWESWESLSRFCRVRIDLTRSSARRIVAKEAVSRLETCSDNYRAVIWQCVRVHFIARGVQASLDNNQTQNLMRGAIINPLESEVAANA